MVSAVEHTASRVCVTEVYRALRDGVAYEVTNCSPCPGVMSMSAGASMPTSDQVCIDVW